MNTKKTRIWDSPTRLFHWALVINIVAAWYTIENRLIELHEIAGYSLLTLIIFRILWGFVGSSTSRFTYFLCSPISALKYLRLSIKQKAHHELGHNPAGGWMVAIMIVIILVQILSGLFANNDLGFSGALSDFVSKESSDLITQLHQLNFDILVAIIWLHVVAVFFYVLVKKDNLVKAMITGYKQLKHEPKQTLYFASPRMGLLCFLIAVAISLGFWFS